MAEDDDNASKTEEPSDKKLSKAREKGQVAQSQEIKTWMVLLGGTIGFALMAPAMLRDVRNISQRFIERPEDMPFDLEHLRQMLANVLVELGWALAPFMGLLLLVAILGNVGQFGLLWAPEKIKPDLSKISIIKGFKNKVSAKALVEFLKGVAKLGVVSLAGVGLAMPLLSDIALLSAQDVIYSLERIHEVTLALAAATLAVVTAIAALDFMFQKHSFTKQMRMTKQEVKDEHKQSEGDPLIKSRIRRLRMERAQHRMMANVPKADVVITNPTHYAVALEYKMDDMSAPRLVAKGVDFLAARIREVAEEHGVPLVENPPLARALYASVELDQEIPTEHYKAVAEVIGYVMRLKGRLPN